MVSLPEESNIWSQQASIVEEGQWKIQRKFSQILSSPEIVTHCDPSFEASKLYFGPKISPIPEEDEKSSPDRSGCSNHFKEHMTPKIRYLFYLNRILSSWGDRSWQLAVGLYLIKLNPDSLFFAAIQGILSSLLIIIFSPMVGRWIERSNRLVEVKYSLFFQNGSVALSSLFVALYFIESNINSKTYSIIINIAGPLCLVIFSIFADFWSSAYALAIEKDWLVALSPNNLEISQLNAVLRRIDLFCQVIAPFLVGFIIEYSQLGSAIFLGLYNIISYFCEFSILKYIYLNGPQEIRSQKNYPINKLRIFDPDAITEWSRDFWLPGLSFALLYLTVLGFDSVTIGYLSSQNISEKFVGIISLLAGLFGVTGTLFYPIFFSFFGLKITGQIGYFTQIMFLTMCLFTVFDFPLLKEKMIFSGINLNIMLFMVGLVTSRFGLWMIDLSINQLIQTETSSPSVVGGVQNSLNIIFGLIKYLLVALFSDVNDFWILIIISYSSVALAAIIFMIYNISVQRNINSALLNPKVYYGSFGVDPTD